MEGEGSPIEVEAEGSLGFEATKGRRTVGVGGSRRVVGAEASVWEGAEMSLGFDQRRRSSFSDDGEPQR